MLENQHIKDGLAWHGTTPIEWDMFLVPLSDIPPYLNCQYVSVVSGYGDWYIDDLLSQYRGRLCWSAMSGLDAFFHAKRLKVDSEYILLAGEWNIGDSFSRKMEEYDVLDLDKLVSECPCQVTDDIAKAAAMVQILNENECALFYDTIRDVFCSERYRKILRQDSNRTPYFVDGISFGYLTDGEVDSFVDLIDDDTLYWLGMKAYFTFGQEGLMYNDVYSGYAEKIKCAEDIVTLWKPVLRSLKRSDETEKQKVKELFVRLINPEATRLKFAGE